MSEKTTAEGRGVREITGGVLFEATGAQSVLEYKIIHAELSSAAKWNRQDGPVLIQTGGPIQVTVSHLDLGNLIGRLMQMADLMGDTAQREAVKRTIKRESRDWLNGIYEEAGYKAAGFDGAAPFNGAAPETL